MNDQPLECLVIGHSHALRMSQVHDSLNAEDGGARPGPRFRFGFLQNVEGEGPGEQAGPRDKARNREENRLDHLRRLLGDGTPDAIVNCLFGNKHNVWSMAQHKSPYDFYFPYRPDISTDRKSQIVPFTMIKQALAETIRGQYLGFLDLMKTLTPDTPTYFVPPPPPVQSAEYLLSQSGPVQERLVMSGISPAPLRLKFWLLNLMILEEFAATYNHIMVKLPDILFDPDGYLAEPYWGDTTHGNADYYRVILRHLDALISKGRD